MQTIYDYLDYSNFLFDRVAELKARGKRFSARQIALAVGINPATFSRVVQGKRKISIRLALKLAAALGLAIKETGYLKMLVLFNQANDEEKKEKYLHEVLRLRANKTSKIDEEQYEYLNHWYNIAIRELLNYFQFSGDLSALAKAFNPPIKKKEAKKAIELLSRLKMIYRNSDGRFQLTDTFLSTGEEWRSLAIHNLQKNFLALASAAIDRLKKEERDFSSLTLSLSRQGFDRVKEKLKIFRSELLSVAHEDRAPEGVYQINFQAFPLTKKKKGSIDEG